MADNPTVDNGVLTDYVVSADEVVATGELLQRVKLAYSADGVATHVTADADGLLVNLGVNNDVTVSGVATAVKQPALGTAGTASADVITIQGIASGTVVPVSDGAGSLTVDNAQLSVVGTGTEAAAMRVTIASDSTGVLSVDDNGGSLTVDGAVTVTNATAANLKAEVTIAAAQTLATVTTVGAVTAITNALPAGTNAIGKLAANSGVDIGDVDVTSLPGAAHDAAISGNPVRIAGRALTADYTAVAAGDTADLITTLLGKLVVYPYANPNQMWSYAAPAGGLVNQTAVTIKAAAGAGIRNYITHIDVVNSHATISTELIINDGAAGTVLWRGWLQAAGGGYSINFDPPLRGTANTLLEIDEVTATGTAGVLFNCVGFTAAE